MSEHNEHEELSIAIYDLYKDVNGIRPRWIDFESMSVVELREMFDGLLEQLERNNKEQVKREAQAVKRFEDKVAELIASGAQSRKTAIKWLWDAEEDEYMDKGFFEYSYGLPYGYLSKAA